MNVHSPRARPMMANRPLSSVAAVSVPSGASGLSARIVAPLIGLAAVVFDETADARDLGRRGGRRSHDERDGDDHTKMVTHLEAPEITTDIHGCYRVSIS